MSIDLKEKLAILGIVLTIIVILFGNNLLCRNKTSDDSDLDILKKENFIEILNVKEHRRLPAWENPSYSDDEIYAIVKGNGRFIKDNNIDYVVVGFWRNIIGSYTDWKICTKRDVSDLRVVSYPIVEINQVNWELIFSGIDLDKEYDGNVAIKLVIYPKEIVEKNSYKWKEKLRFGGHEELPFLKESISSKSKMFETKPNRE